MEARLLAIKNVDHIGIRVADRDRSITFYETLGFETIADAGFETGHPIIMRHPSGVVLNLLGPSTVDAGVNILMDTDDKHSGYTHMALHVVSLADARALFEREKIEITGQFSFDGISAIFVRDPDRNVIELDEHTTARGDAWADHPHDAG